MCGNIKELVKTMQARKLTEELEKHNHEIEHYIEAVCGIMEMDALGIGDSKLRSYLLGYIFNLSTKYHSQSGTNFLIAMTEGEISCENCCNVIEIYKKKMNTDVDKVLLEQAMNINIDMLNINFNDDIKLVRRDGSRAIMVSELVDIKRKSKEEYKEQRIITNVFDRKKVA